MRRDGGPILIEVLISLGILRYSLGTQGGAAVDNRIGQGIMDWTIGEKTPTRRRSAMNKESAWLLKLSLLLILASAATYVVHYLIFHDAHHIFLYMIGDIAFLFIDVLLTILLLGRLLAQREKRTILQKLNMVIGTFFSEVGLELLTKFSSFTANEPEFRKDFGIRPNWTRKDFGKAIETARRLSYDLKIDPRDLEELKALLNGKRDFLVRLLENPNLFEHDRFTDLLWAVFHLAEELSFRKGALEDLPRADYNHLLVDAKRAYSHIIGAWLAYTEHLKASYPFLFSLAARINPLGENPSAIVL